ncbi:nitrite reductase large subunit [Alginatibacterium sediminis]|uniref:Nitrite reductase large subunit n=1 Tax=Alginatibacterium sediminis TaxID=2164068 RepID=A0A420ELD6_9ALTE|nr:nitrite reductase large subunit NirB [Alginatibacterium sediminis]RKF21498.1 nitrite reductase large subunit [Alginatibacterium sediminis]
MKKIIVVGNGMVGHHFIDQLLASDSEFEITTFSEEAHLAYDRVHLSSYFTDNSVEALMLTNEQYYDDNGVRYLVNDRVVAIDKTLKCIHTQNGVTASYDSLVIATGSFPFVPPIPGNDNEHCHVYRTIEDLDAIRNSAKDAQIGVVVGGGLLGLEAGKALVDLGLKTHVVEFAPRLMAVQLCSEGGGLLRGKIEELGVEVHTEKNTQSITQGESCRYRMNFADGSFLETDLILFSAGIRPQDKLARDSQIEIGERGGIVINDYCQTSEPDIYAIGECALWQGKIFGLVAPGYSMAKVAAKHIDGHIDKQFLGADMSTKLKLLGVDVASIGDAHGVSDGCKTYQFLDGVNGVYKKLVVNSSGDRLLGAIMVGDASDYGQWLQLYLNDMPLSQGPEYLLLPDADEGSSSSAMGVDALPDSASICSCFDVTKGQIREAVQAGACSMADIKSCTKASTGCGGCSALTTQVLNSELEKQGVEVSTDICAHFAYSRQELFDIIRVKKIQSYDALLSEYGSGGGCEICKPAVGSILASLWNDYVLDDAHIGLQDTNDIFLGNMQKDGTYSVVPRVPGGEITPDKLIAIGQVAKQFDLYTKVTGGQRIDLFGAQLHELPIIWQQLIDAGFETGHAYGKSLRTVKSCVGSTWCRFGVQDSVGMAIDLENRYKGLRAPHKIKFGVSGCTRECAEAQSKDIGIIATENGWGLYVCGNGGMRPRHADLFATDLDDQTLVKYIDRVLMFYVRTADRLQRTSVWMENLDGGLDYLKEVVIDDKLNIAAELESDMQNVVANYQCEWKTTINDEKRLQRFKQFINTDELDSNISYVRERGQRRPATEVEKISTIELVTEA